MKKAILRHIIQLILSLSPVCSKIITINANGEKVCGIITNISNWGKWQTDIKDARLQGAIQPNTKFIWKRGGAKVHSTLHTVDPFKQFGWRGQTYRMYAILNWTFTETNCQTTVVVNESMEKGCSIGSIY